MIQFETSVPKNMGWKIRTTPNLWEGPSESNQQRRSWVWWHVFSSFCIYCQMGESRRGNEGEIYPWLYLFQIPSILFTVYLTSRSCSMYSQQCTIELSTYCLPAQYNSFCYSANNVHIFAALIIYVGYTDGQDIATAISVFREKYWKSNYFQK